MSKPIDLSRIERYQSLDFLARQVVEGFITGLHKSPFHGFSVEFSEHRQYNTGESIKDIDWKLFGRTDKLFVKRYEEETNLRCQIVIDHSSSMYYPVKENISITNPDKITFSVYAAASIIYLLKKQRDAFGLSVFSNQIDIGIAARSSSIHYKHVITQLESLLKEHSPEEKRATSAIESLHIIADSVHKRSLVIIFSDMFDNQMGNEEVFNALQHLRHNKHEVILFNVTDMNKEYDFDFKSRPYKFIDMESGKEIRVNPNEVRKAYVEALYKFKSELRIKCGQYQVDYVEADINKGFDQILLPYLIKRSRLY